MAAESSKILVLGSASGAIATLVAKIKTFHSKHGPFDAVFCVGDFFSPSGENQGLDDVLNGTLTVPAPTFVLSSPVVATPSSVKEKTSEPNGELCPNVMLLEGKGRLTLPGTGVHVAYSSGNEPLSPSDLETDETTHIVLTHSHPSTVMPTLPTSAGETDADLLLKHCKPRYAFSGASGQFLEKEPFPWAGSEYTRCISLGALGGQKQRWYYAFSISPLVPPPAPTNAIPNPYEAPPAPVEKGEEANGSSSVSAANKRKFEAIAAEEGNSVDYRWGGEGKKPKRAKNDLNGKPPPGYKCRVCESSEHYVNVCPEKLERDQERAKARENEKPPEGYKCRKCGSSEHFIRLCPEASKVGDTGGSLPPDGYVCRACGGSKHYFKDCEVAAKGRTRGGQKKEIGPDECWFCLSNPNVTKHLIVSIGNETYLTLPRGSLIPPLQPPSPHTIPGGGHILIIPISHYPTLLSLPPELSLPIITEIEAYKSALRDFYLSQGCGTVVWEIARLTGKGGHAHLQVCPVPIDLTDAVEAAFQSEGELGGIDWEEDDAPAASEKALQTGGNYLRVELPNGKRLLHAIKPGPPFNLQFARMVLAKVLKVPDRADWKACHETEDDEKEAANRFKAAFAPFDPTLK